MRRSRSGVLLTPAPPPAPRSTDGVLASGHENSHPRRTPRSAPSASAACRSRGRGRDGTLPDPDRAVATVHAALDLGVTLIDTADCYGPDGHPRDGGLGHNEEIVARALRGRPEDVLVATKGGIRRDGADWPIDGRPAWIHEAVRGSLRRLGVERDRPLPAPPARPGRCRTPRRWAPSRSCTTPGWCAASASRTPTSTRSRRRARCWATALVSVQNQYSPAFRSSEDELELCGRLGLAFLPWSPLGGMSGAAGLGRRARGVRARSRGRTA